MRRCHFLGLHFLFSPLEARLFVVSPLHSFSSALTPPTTRWGIFFSLSWLLEPGSASLPGIRSSPWSCQGWVLARQEPRFVCWRVCLDRWGTRPPRRRGLVPAPPGRAGHKLAAALICSVSWLWPAWCSQGPGGWTRLPGSSWARIPPGPALGFLLSTFNCEGGGGLGKLKLNREKGGERTTLDEPVWLV